MEGYFKRFFIGYFFIIVVIGISFYVGLSLVSILMWVLLMEALFFLLDLKYLTKRKTELANRLIDVFDAEPISKELVQCKVGGLDLFAEIEVDFKLGMTQLANAEHIRFHLPDHEVDRLATKPLPGLKEDEIDGIHTYILHQTDGEGLDFAKEKLEMIIKEIKLLPTTE